MMAALNHVTVRSAVAADHEAVAEIWHRGWQDGHAGHVPEALQAVRTPESFSLRAPQRLTDTTVAEVDGRVAGFVMVVEDEVEQVYVAAAHRGSGVAGLLLSEAERLISASGHTSAWLAVVSGNKPARRFYAKRGWSDRGPLDYQAAGPEGPISVPTLRYEKAV